VRKKVKT
ncbi:Late transcription factor VLTF-4 (1), partial [Monkeypox virus]